MTLSQKKIRQSAKNRREHVHDATNSCHSLHLFTLGLPPTYVKVVSGIAGRGGQAAVRHDKPKAKASVNATTAIPILTPRGRGAGIDHTGLRTCPPFPHILSASLSRGEKYSVQELKGASNFTQGEEEAERQQCSQAKPGRGPDHQQRCRKWIAFFISLAILPQCQASVRRVG